MLEHQGLLKGAYATGFGSVEFYLCYPGFFQMVFGLVEIIRPNGDCIAVETVGGRHHCVVSHLGIALVY